jgi:hypothetical protein
MRKTKTSPQSSNGNTDNNQHTKQSPPKRHKPTQGERTRQKIINWKEYNEALVRRGQFTLWISDN